MKLVCRSNGGGGSRVSWFLQNGGSWECLNGGACVCWQAVEDGLWFFPNPCVWICWRWRTSMGAEWATMGTFCWEPLEGGGGGRGRNPYSVGVGKGEAETESLILWLVVLELLAGGWWWHEAHNLIQGWLETHILYTWLWERQPWRWVRLSDWVKETHVL